MEARAWRRLIAQTLSEQAIALSHWLPAHHGSRTSRLLYHSPVTVVAMSADSCVSSEGCSRVLRLLSQNLAARLRVQPHALPIALASITTGDMRMSHRGIRMTPHLCDSRATDLFVPSIIAGTFDEHHL